MINPSYYSPIPHDHEKENLQREVNRLTKEYTLAIALNNALQVRLDQKEARILELTTENEALTDKLAEITVEADRLQKQLDFMQLVP